jgi:DNA-binding transcriptional MerR regulator
VSEIPDKFFYKAGEVCKYTDTQPYVLRFWESEFPQLGSTKNRGGQRVYSREDLDLIARIKKLLYEQEYTIAGVRELLEREAKSGATLAGRPFPAELGGEWEESQEATPNEQDDGNGDGAVAVHLEAHADSYKASYEAARREIDLLRSRLAEAEDGRHRAEVALEAAERVREAGRERSERVAARLEAFLATLEAGGKGKAKGPRSS